VRAARKESSREEFTGPAHMAAMLTLSGYALRTWRLREGLTLEAAGKVLGCSSGHLSRIERGARLGPTPEHCAKAIGVTVEEFLAPCPACGWDPPDRWACPDCGTVQSAAQVAAEIASWITRAGSE
jgi:transcriptional regulator with XRE-family HTH domain